MHRGRCVYVCELVGLSLIYVLRHTHTVLLGMCVCGDQSEHMGVFALGMELCALCSSAACVCFCATSASSSSSSAHHSGCLIFLEKKKEKKQPFPLIFLLFPLSLFLLLLSLASPLQLLHHLPSSSSSPHPPLSSLIVQRGSE